MQVKKFEAPTLQEALDTIKRELGPEAIILQTKQNRKGFGLMSKGSVEVTAAVSERSLDKKKNLEKRLPEAYQQKMTSMKATTQADLYDQYLQKRLERDQVKIGQNTAHSQSNTSYAVDANQATRGITAVRYAEIEDEGSSNRRFEQDSNETETNIPEYSVPRQVQGAMEQFSQSRQNGIDELKEEVSRLKTLVESLKREHAILGDSPLEATEAIHEAYETLIQSGVERRFAIQTLRESTRNLGIEARTDRDQVLDSVAESLLSHVMTTQPYSRKNTNGAEIQVMIGAPGVGKTSTIAKLATQAVRSKNERVGLIRVIYQGDESVDALSVFAKALHLPYRTVRSFEEMQSAVADLGACQRIFIDTSGVAPSDQKNIRNISQILSAIPQAQITQVLSSINRDLETSNQIKAFKSIRAEQIIFTRVDECNSPGAMFSISLKSKLPIAALMSGKKVTEGFEVASPERITASILNIL